MQKSTPPTSTAFPALAEGGERKHFVRAEFCEHFPYVAYSQQLHIEPVFESKKWQKLQSTKLGISNATLAVNYVEVESPVCQM
jgi:hypothetical protein